MPEEGARRPTDHPRSARVRRRPEFLRVQKKGVRIHTRCFTVIALRGEGTRPRLGMAVSRRVGPAVLRNRIRRLVREVFRHVAPSLPLIDFVIIAKQEAAGLVAGRADLEADLRPGLERAAERAARMVVRP